MASGLPADLVAEARSTLDSVGRLSLPAHAWPAVQKSLVRADAAVEADDASALSHALGELHRMGVNAPDRRDAPEVSAPHVLPRGQPTGLPPASRARATARPTSRIDRTSGPESIASEATRRSSGGVAVFAGVAVAALLALVAAVWIVIQPHASNTALPTRASTT